MATYATAATTSEAPYPDNMTQVTEEVIDVSYDTVGNYPRYRRQTTTPRREQSPKHDMPKHGRWDGTWLKPSEDDDGNFHDFLFIAIGRINAEDLEIQPKIVESAKKGQEQNVPISYVQFGGTVVCAKVHKIRNIQMEFHVVDRGNKRNNRNNRNNRSSRGKRSSRGMRCHGDKKVVRTTHLSNQETVQDVQVTRYSDNLKMGLKTSKKLKWKDVNDCIEIPGQLLFVESTAVRQDGGVILICNGQEYPMKYLDDGIFVLPLPEGLSGDYSIRCLNLKQCETVAQEFWRYQLVWRQVSYIEKLAKIHELSLYNGQNDDGSYPVSFPENVKEDDVKEETSYPVYDMWNGSKQFLEPLFQVGQNWFNHYEQWCVEPNEDVPTYGYPPIDVPLVPNQPTYEQVWQNVLVKTKECQKITYLPMGDDIKLNFNRKARNSGPYQPSFYVREIEGELQRGPIAYNQY